MWNMCAVAVVKSSKHFEIKHSSRVKLIFKGLRDRKVHELVRGALTDSVTREWHPRPIHQTLAGRLVRSGAPRGCPVTSPRGDQWTTSPRILDALGGQIAGSGRFGRPD